MKGALAPLLLWPAWCARLESNLDLEGDAARTLAVANRTRAGRHKLLEDMGGEGPRFPWGKDHKRFKELERLRVDEDGELWKVMDLKLGYPVLLKILGGSKEANRRGCELQQSMESQVSKHPEGRLNICKCLEYHEPEDPATAAAKAAAEADAKAADIYRAQGMRADDDVAPLRKFCARMAPRWHEERLAGGASTIPPICEPWPEFYDARNEKRSASEMLADYDRKVLADYEPARFTFLVLEFCGTDLMRRMYQQVLNLGDDRSDDPFGEQGDPLWLPKVRKWVRGLVEGIAYLSSLDPPIMHLSLNPEHVTVSHLTGRAEITNFGSSLPVNEYECVAWEQQDVGGDFVPPEAYHMLGSDCKDYTAENAWAYDVWSVGSIYYALLCPEDWDDGSGASWAVHEGESLPEGCVGGMGTPPEHVPHFVGTRHEYGTEEDWAVIKSIWTKLEDRPSPEALLKMLPA